MGNKDTVRRVQSPSPRGTGKLAASGCGCDFVSVIANNDRPVNYGDRSCHVAEFLKLVECAGIGQDVALLKCDSVLRKKLFRLLAEHSAGLRKNRNLLRHRDLLVL
jgi:hypothetical protein